MLKFNFSCSIFCRIIQYQFINQKKKTRIRRGGKRTLPVQIEATNHQFWSLEQKQTNPPVIWMVDFKTGRIPAVTNWLRIRVSGPDPGYIFFSRCFIILHTCGSFGMLLYGLGSLFSYVYYVNIQIDQGTYLKSTLQSLRVNIALKCCRDFQYLDY